MEQTRKIKRSGILTILLFIAAIALLLAGGIGGAQAVFSTESETYYSHVEMKHIGIRLMEKNAGDTSEFGHDTIYGCDGNQNTEADNEGLLEKLVPEGENFKIGKTYMEELRVRNTGTIDEYVRVILYKYWMNEKGEKVQTLSPSLIDLHLTNVGEGEEWLIDDKNALSGTQERTILYYYKPIAPEEITEMFSDTLTVDGDVLRSAIKTVESKTDDGHTVISTTYEYNGYTFMIEVFTDGVQTHNAERAIHSAWGIEVNIAEDGTLSLKEGA